MTPENPGNNDVYREYNWENTSPCTAIIESVNTFEKKKSDTGFEESRTPLYDCIDVDALDTIVTSADEFRLSFTYTEYTIEIDSGSIRVSSR